MYVCAKEREKERERESERASKTVRVGDRDRDMGWQSQEGFLKHQVKHQGSFAKVTCNSRAPLNRNPAIEGA